MKCPTALLTLPLLFAAPAIAADAQPRPDQLAFRDIYKELVETDTTLSAGSCTLAAERMAARLTAAGFADSQLTLFADPRIRRRAASSPSIPAPRRRRSRSC